MDKFTTENTEGFNQDVLDKMNNEYNSEVQKLDESDSMFDEKCQAVAEKIFNKYT